MNKAVIIVCALLLLILGCTISLKEASKPIHDSKASSDQVVFENVLDIDTPTGPERSSHASVPEQSLIYNDILSCFQNAVRNYEEMKDTLILMEKEIIGLSSQGIHLMAYLNSDGIPVHFDDYSFGEIGKAEHKYYLYDELIFIVWTRIDYDKSIYSILDDGEDVIETTNDPSLFVLTENAMYMIDEDKELVVQYDENNYQQEIAILSIYYDALEQDDDTYYSVNDQD